MTDRNYYEVLGIPPNASVEQIKRRFRALARRHHPDVAGNQPASHELFIKLSEAYQVLSDPGRRADYDLMLRDRERLRSMMAGPRGAATRRPSPPAPARAQAPPAAAAHFVGARAASTAAQRAAQTAQEARRRAQLEQILHAATAAYSLGKLKDSVRLCRTLLEQDRQCAPAYELLGDIYGRQRRTDLAIQMYTMAAQYQPENGLVMAKLNRLLAREGGVGTQPGTQSAPRAAVRYPRTRSHATAQVLTMFLGLGAVVFMMMLFVITPAGTAFRTVPLIDHWNETLLCLLVVSGWLTGLTLAVAGLIRPIDEELLYPSFRTGRSGLPLGVLLMVTGGLFFYLGVAIYTIVATVQEAVSGSVLLILVCTTLITAAFGGLAWFSSLDDLEQARQILLLGGNVIFLAMLAGWFIGDIFRPLWA